MGVYQKYRYLSTTFFLFYIKIFYLWVTIQDQCMEINESSCLHVRDFDFHTLILIGLPPPHMSIFSLAKGEKRTRSVRNVNVEEGRRVFDTLFFH